jgi:hypothetical protein
MRAEYRNHILCSSMMYLGVDMKRDLPLVSSEVILLSIEGDIESSLGISC